MAPPENLFSKSPLETQRIVWQALQQEAGKERLGAFCVALAGELGSGKTTLAQGLGKKLGMSEPLTSPTFLLMKEFILKRSWKGMARMYHFDWYRLKSSEQVRALGWDSLMRDRKNFIVVEWADKFPKLFPVGTVWIFLAYQKEARTVKIGIS